MAREPLEDVAYGIPGFDDPQRRVIAATVGGVRLINVYVPNGQAVGSDKYAYKLDWLGRLTDYVTGELALHPRLAIVGDYNIAPEDRDVHDPAKWEGSVHVSAAERAALQDLLKTGPRRHLPPVRAAAGRLQLVGLPDGRLSPQPRAANRPGIGQSRAGLELHRLPRGSDPPNLGAAIGSRAGPGDV